MILGTWSTSFYWVSIIISEQRALAKWRGWRIDSSILKGCLNWQSGRRDLPAKQQLSGFLPSFLFRERFSSDPQRKLPSSKPQGAVQCKCGCLGLSPPSLMAGFALQALEFPGGYLCIITLWSKSLIRDPRSPLFVNMAGLLLPSTTAFLNY